MSTKNLRKNVYRSFIIAETWKQPICPSTSEWINKLLYIHIRECYSTIKRNEISYETMTRHLRGKLKCILLSQRSQSENATYDMISTT